MAVVVVAPMIAPIIGGEILVRFGWQWIFGSLAVYSGLVLILVTHFIKDTSKPKTTNKQLPFNLLLLAFRQYYAIISHRLAMSHILTGSFSFAGLFAFVAGSPYVYIEYFGIKEDTYGYLFAINSLGVILMNLLNANLLKNIEPAKK